VYQLALASFEYNTLELLKCYQRIREVAFGTSKPAIGVADAFYLGLHDGDTRVIKHYDKPEVKAQPIRKFF